MRVCLNYLQLTERTATCTANPANAATGQLCQNGNVKVSGISWNGSKVSVECLYAGDAVDFIINNCGTQGGEWVFLLDMTSFEVDGGGTKY